MRPIMPDPNFIILYVDNPPLSARFYADLLGKPPVESSATFAMFALYLPMFARESPAFLKSATSLLMISSLCFAVVFARYAYATQ